MSIGAMYGSGQAPRYEPHERVVDSTIGVGIEIETEGVEEHIPDSSYWSVKGDGSLREGGVELVSRVLYGKDIIEALKEVEGHVKKSTPTWRCAVHVHVDVRHLDWPHIKTISEIYATLEPLIFAWEGNNRDTSRFCVPWFSAIGAANTISNIIQHHMKGGTSKARLAARYRDMLHRVGKYSAFNLIPITTQGSVEFRHMETTTNMERILEYVNLCITIVTKGAELEGEDVLRLMSEHGPHGFIMGLLGGGARVLSTVDNFDLLLWKGVDTANLIETGTRKKARNRSLSEIPIIK